MSDLEQKIRDALAAEDAEWIGRFGGEPCIFEMIRGASPARSWSRWWLGLAYGVIATAAVLLAVSAMQCWRATTERDMLFWGIGLIFCSIVIGTTKIWVWLEWNRRAVVRDLKGAELQVAQLADRVRRLEVDQTRPPT